MSAVSETHVIISEPKCKVKEVESGNILKSRYDNYLSFIDEIKTKNNILRGEFMLIAPSALTADFAKLKQEIESIDNADIIHLDIMDGNFVPNLSFGPHIAKNNSTKLKFHLIRI